ncbi:toxin-antitoxin system YwqK family antitoxin [Aureivirga sp. CE67]|uniref:toxin-antitoxin system YwqK family antitoxin n=1 Tax=Aureivirga sp. CE67 TaxID=1788983 RepID=UPI0018CA2EEB|nr:toxin-antitoxin system YwqK family antitoxin [Aureivirga sp. CE67]
MKKLKAFIVIFFMTLLVFSQNKEAKILYIVDSIPIIEEPQKGFGDLMEYEIEKMEVVKDKKLITEKGYKDFDGIIYIYTKEFEKRSDSIKAIPTTKSMTRKNGVWHLKDADQPYTGPFIDYYINGKKEGEGYLSNGTLKGKRTQYYKNGVTSSIVEYENGISNGTEKLFYKNGILKQKGVFKNGKEVGVWEMYHPNGRLKQQSTFKNGKIDGENISYYSTGEIQGKNYYENGVYKADKKTEKLFKLYNKSQELYNQGNLKGAIKKLDKVIKEDPNWAKAYFARGTMKLNSFDFDEAIEDFNKAIKIEPYYTKAYSNRAFSIIRKYQFGNAKTLSNSNGVQILASKEKELPKAEKKKVCKDLSKAILLEDEHPLVIEAYKEHCK